MTFFFTEIENEPTQELLQKSEKLKNERNSGLGEVSKKGKAIRSLCLGVVGRNWTAAKVIYTEVGPLEAEEELLAWPTLRTSPRPDQSDERVLFLHCPHSEGRLKPLWP